ncbi:uncharacterized protein BX663DRAFT_409469, partial [Cokeromyces recurvatus]|uniref:uncharacterized protein n=1 Tax=Cokeromyces recurvatus TaxID=90255 RepID=UPI00221E5C6D
AKFKSNIRRNPLKKRDELTPRVAEAYRSVTPKYCKVWIRNATSYWDRCLQK